MLKAEIRKHLEEKILPFWARLRDGENGGFYGYMDEALRLDRKADKGGVPPPGRRTLAALRGAGLPVPGPLHGCGARWGVLVGDV